MADYKYTIEHQGGKATLVCKYCRHRVPVCNFLPQNGNPRTQAATSIGAHINGTHWGELVKEQQQCSTEREKELHADYPVGRGARKSWPTTRVGGPKVREPLSW
jgi:hypothetical protein